MGWDEAWTQPEQPSIFAGRKISLLALPAAFVAAAALNAVGLGLLPLLAYHEFGHAAAAWLAGRFAIAIPIAGLTFIGQERSWLVTAVLGGGLGWLFKRSWEGNDYIGIVASLAGLLGMADLAFLVSSAGQDAWILWGGCAGELGLSTLVICSFYWPIFKEWRWDFWRYPLLLTAACTFLYSASLWRNAAAPDQRLMGEKLSQSRENDNDWVRLVKEHGWTSQDIVESYVDLAEGCGAAIGLQYVWFLLAP